MWMRSFVLKLAVAMGFWAVAFAAWAEIEDPLAGGVTVYPNTDIPVSGTSVLLGKQGTLKAFKDYPGGVPLQQQSFFTNATSGEYQDSGAEGGSPAPVLDAPPWQGDRVYIVAYVDGENDGLTYVFIEDE